MRLERIAERRTQEVIFNVMILARIKIGASFCNESIINRLDHEVAAATLGTHW